MHAKTLLPAICLLALPSVAGAGESVQLDKDFSLQLEQPNPASPPSETFPIAPTQPPRLAPDTLRTPNGERLPPGTRQGKFNGLPYYIIPL